MDEHTRELDEWRRMVGTAILSFGDIEFITLKCGVRRQETHCGPRIHRQ